MEKSNLVVQLNSLNRYIISTDHRYGHNIDSCFDEKFGFWVYKDKNGLWVKTDDLDKLIKIPQTNKYIICNNCGFENIELNTPFNYDFDTENWIRVDNDGLWVKWTDINVLI